MDPHELARITGISLAEAEDLASWSGSEASTVSDVAQHTPRKDQSKEDQDIEFLHSCFPHIPLAVVRIKYLECHDLEQASDLLLNYDITRQESGSQYVDRLVSRKARQRAKQSKKRKRLEQKHELQVEALKEVIDDLSVDEIRELYIKNNYKFDQTITAHYKQAAPHVHAMIAGMERLNMAEKLSKGSTNSPNSSPKFDLSRDRDKNAAALEAELETLRNLKSTKGVPGVLIAESQARLANLRSQLAESVALEALDNSSRHKDVIDFHEMTLHAAIVVCETRVKEWKEQRSPELYLITGAGRHSNKGIPVVKNAVRKIVNQLNDRRYFVHEEEGAFLLTRSAV